MLLPRAAISPLEIVMQRRAPKIALLVKKRALTIRSPCSSTPWICPTGVRELSTAAKLLNVVVPIG